MNETKYKPAKGPLTQLSSFLDAETESSAWQGHRRHDTWINVWPNNITLK